MSKIAEIFPGQGSQLAGMGKDFYEKSAIAKEIFDTTSERLGIDMKELCFEKNDKLDLTEYTQAALVNTCLAMARTAESMGLKADVTAGLSLGEYSAIAFAGGMFDRDAISAVRQRGIFMQEAVPVGKGAMSAVLGMTGEQVESGIEKFKEVYVANYNCPGQIVITGVTEDVKQAGDVLKKNGAKRVIPLNVSGPFHSPLLKDAGLKLNRILATIPMRTLQIPYVTNVTADYVTNIIETQRLLVSQITSSVKWQQSMERMIADGVDTFIEIGPGKTLTGFLRKINRNLTSYNISTWNELEKTMEILIEEKKAC